MKESATEQIIELLGKPEFKQWVIRPTEESNYFWNKWMEEHPDAKESALKAREVILRIHFETKKLTGSEKEQLLGHIISNSRTIRRSKPQLHRYWLKYAAALVLILFPVLLYLTVLKPEQPQHIAETKNITRTNPKGQKSVVHLPDGSLVTLNSNSTLKYRSDFLQNRYIELQGEAYFQVEKDPAHPFVVKSGNVRTTALGTAFNVNTKRSALEVILVEGKVRVEEADNASDFQILNPNQKIVYEANTGLSEVREISDLNATLWTQGILYFNNTPLSEVTQTLEDWYAVDITLEGDHGAVTYSGRFEKEYLSNILKSMSFSLDLEYSMKGKQVNIKLNDANEER